MAKTKNTKPVVADEALVPLLDGPKATDELGITADQRRKLIASGVLVTRGTQRRPHRGRPPVLLALTGAARKRVRKAAQAA